jgi:hypothetical protein
VADWVTISSLATAGGTLVLALATFGSVRSANRAARVAERALLTNLRPLLVPSRPDDPQQKIGFADEKYVLLPGGGAAVETGEDAVYLALSMRNVGSGLAVLHGWYFHEGVIRNTDEHPAPEEFRRLTRDIYIAAGDIGFWQGALRDREDPDYRAAETAVRELQSITIDLLYGDQEGGQRVVTRCAFRPHHSGAWIPAVSRHWNVDRQDPR